MGALLDSMRAASAAMVTSGGFETAITVTDKSDNTAVVNGVATLHNTRIDTNTGLTVNDRQAHCLFATSAITAAGLDPYADTKKPGKVSMKGWRVAFADAHGKSWSFVIVDARPDETYGLVTCFLGDKV